ncbi:helix-turn-helix domain-containing protein [Phenylobacterium sp.]|uniref:helix-turn-helix domain-containing protein n=1 Tax=Phenylobacterium sp. TaxID=1871053 RepID=UPI0025E75FA2|nr:helix-turn-helix transcriptional regulator [Phenylobacterium sp.]MBX3485712.1 helix-turn-helix transcriptional regulator [Phenylobacterium sp.]MCW5758814.1 helix-turn-helix transcriptional regulator [Phenylobacterium sp.]
MWIGPDDHKIVGRQLRRYRLLRGVTQDELALRLRKPQSFVSSYERGQRRVDFVEFVTIMRALRMDPVEVGTMLLDHIDKELDPPKPQSRGRKPAG